MPDASANNNQPDASANNNQPDASASNNQLVPLHRYNHSWLNDHYLSAADNRAELEAKGYVYEHIEGYVWTEEKADLVALRRFFNATKLDHLYTISTDDAALTTAGYVLQGTEGFVSAERAAGSVALHRVSCAEGEDTAYTTNAFQEYVWTMAGCDAVGIEAYLWPYATGTLPEGHCYDPSDCDEAETCGRKSRLLASPPIISVCGGSCEVNANCAAIGSSCLGADPLDDTDKICTSGCNLLTNEGCFAGTQCYLGIYVGISNEAYTACTGDVGTAVLNGSCTEELCGLGLACINDVCLARCRVGVPADCTGDRTCDTQGEPAVIGADTWGLCL